MNGPQPVVKAFLICDQVIRDVYGKHSIIGIFRRVHCEEFPVFHSKIGFYMSLGSLNGDYDFSLSFREPKEDREIAGAEMRGVKFRQPLVDFETGMNLPGLRFEEAGVHEVHLFCNHKLLHVDTLSVVKAEEQQFKGVTDDN
jgi:hypothetical protein